MGIQDSRVVDGLDYSVRTGDGDVFPLGQKSACADQVAGALYINRGDLDALDFEYSKIRLRTLLLFDQIAHS